MIRFIIFMFSTPVIFQVLNYLLRGFLARPIMEFLGAEVGAMVYPGIILILTFVIEHLLFFRGSQGTETIIHDDPPAEEAKKKAQVKKIEVPAEVKEFKEDKFEEVSFLDEAKEVKPDERLVFVQDVEKNKNNDLKIFAFVVVFVWLVGLSIFVSYTYNNPTDWGNNNSTEIESSSDYTDSDIKHLEFQLENARKKIDYLENEIYSLNDRVRDLEPDYYNGY